VSLLFCSEDGRQGLELSAEAVAAIQEQALLKHPHETGGILLGYYSTNLRMATAVVAIPPPPDSKHGPFNFERGTKGLKELLARYKKQTPSLHYLGEWHTHPAYTAKASGLDVRQMRCSALRRLYGAKSPILLVVGGVPPDKLQWQASTHKAWRAPTYLDLF
jgi:integrative and conjugative element protein (TIGR02256 family)